MYLDDIRNGRAEQLEKLICVSGDMAFPQHDLNIANSRSMVSERVNIFIHAATYCCDSMSKYISRPAGTIAVAKQQVIHSWSTIIQIEGV